MSGRSAMAVRIGDSIVEGCDEVLSDVCLTFVEVLVRLASGVIAGAKPAAIFGLPLRAYRAGCWRHLSRRQLDEVLCAYASVLPSYGVTLSVLYRTERRVFLLVWRPRQVDAVLAEPDARQILREAGYAGVTSEELVAELRRRLVDYYRGAQEADGREFPHEIGVFLGYPACDVRGFMAGEEATCVGPWHAYGDPESAQRRFRALERQERRCRRRYEAGEPLHALFAPQREWAAV